MGLTLPEQPLFTNRDLRNADADYNSNLPLQWRKQGTTEKVRNGLYLRSDHVIHGYWDWFCIAYKLYEPSYVSLISAFRLYNFIPESVYSVTSITTRKTKRFLFLGKLIKYRHLKDEFYFGFTPEEWRGSTFNLATPEKALVDMVYLDDRYSDPDWIYEMRFDYFEMHDLIDRERLDAYTNYFRSRVVRQRIDLILRAMDECLK